MFPLGELNKTEVRELAREAGLPVFDKPDSTGICFIGERPFREFLARYIPTNPGDIVTERGEVVGRHRGLAFYTLGQRGGLEIGGRAGQREDAWYVAAKNLARNELIAVQGHDHPLLVSRALATGPCNWLVQPPAPQFDSQIKVRYRQADQACHATTSADGALDVRFTEPQRAVTPGQFAVLYDGDRCLGRWRHRAHAAAITRLAELEYRACFRPTSGDYFMTGSSNTRSTLQVGSRSYDYWSFAKLPADKVARLPYSLKILLENLLRFEDGVNVTQDDIEAVLNWDAKATAVL